MKLSLLILLPLAFAAPLAAPIEEREAKAEALDLGLGLKLHGDLAVALPTQLSSTNQLPVDNITAALTPVLDSTGSPANVVKDLVLFIEDLLANNGLIPLGRTVDDISDLLQALLTGNTLQEVGTVLNQVLQAVNPGPETQALVNQVIATLQTLLGLFPVSPVERAELAAQRRAIRRSPSPSPEPQAAGVVPAVDTLLNSLIGTLSSFQPVGATVDSVTSLLNTIVDTLSRVTEAIGAGGLEPLPSKDVLSNLLNQVFKLLTNILKKLPGNLQNILIGDLSTVLSKLLKTIIGVPSLGGVVTSLVNTLLGLVGSLGGALTGAVGGLLSGLLGGLLGIRPL